MTTSTANPGRAGGDPDLVRMVEEYCSRTFAHEVISSVEEHGPDRELWDGVEALGLPLIGVDDDSGGSGGTLLDLVAVLQVAGRFAAPVPLAETNLAGWLLASAGAEIPAGPMTVAPDSSNVELRDGLLHGAASRVPWLRGSDRLVLHLADGADVKVVSVDTAALYVEPGSDLAGMPCDAFVAAGVPVEAWSTDLQADDLALRGALLRSALMAGALAGAFDMTTTYVKEREQFGRPIGQFQSVQVHLVEIAQAATMTALCVERAALAAESGDGRMAIRSTKSVLGHHTTNGARAAHQAHGAIGVTQEYGLQLLTRRLNTWRGEFGDDISMNLAVGRAVRGAGSIMRPVTAVGGEHV